MYHSHKMPCLVDTHLMGKRIHVVSKIPAVTAESETNMNKPSLAEHDPRSLVQYQCQNCGPLVTVVTAAAGLMTLHCTSVMSCDLVL